MTILTGARLYPRKALAAGRVNWLTAVGNGLLVSAAAAYLVMYIALAYARMGYPYELEWMEGGSVDHVRRILAGLPVYAQPSLDFTAYIYTPLYWYVAAGVSMVLDVGFLPLRLVSFAASLGCFGILYRFVRRETGSASWALVAAGLYAATYRASGAWFDVARVDSLAVLLLLAAIYQVHFAQRWGHMVIAGVLVSLAFLSKQTMLIVALPLSVYCLAGKDRWAGIAFVGTWIGLVGGTTWLLNAATDGWYSYYVFDLPGDHQFRNSMWRKFWTIDLMMYMGLALATTAWYLYSLASQARWRQLSFYAALAIGMVGSAWIARVHRGGYDNVLQPAYAFLAIGFALGARTLQRRWRKQPLGLAGAMQEDSGIPRKCWLAARPLAVYVLGIAQFAVLCYSPGRQVPSAADQRAGHAFTAMLRGIDGSVFVPDTGFLPWRTGHQTFAQTMAVRDVLQGADCPARDRLMNEIREAIRGKRFDAIILQSDYWFMKDLARNYTFKGQIFADKERFWPVTGQHTRPSLLYVAKDRQVQYPRLPLDAP